MPFALVLLLIYGLNTSTGMVVCSSTVQGAVPDAVRGRVFTVLDVTWAIMQLLSLAVGGALVDRAGIQPVYWAGGGPLVLAGVLGLALLGGSNFKNVGADGGTASPCCSTVNATETLLPQRHGTHSGHPLTLREQRELLKAPPVRDLAPASARAPSNVTKLVETTRDLWRLAQTSWLLSATRVVCAQLCPTRVESSSTAAG